MIRKNPSGDLPVIHESAFVDPTAIICGKVFIGENVFIGPYVVIRADEVEERGGMEPIIISANSNIQDGVVIHSKSGARVQFGEHTSIAHRSIVHSPCVVGRRCVCAITLWWKAANCPTVSTSLPPPTSMPTPTSLPSSRSVSAKKTSPKTWRRPTLTLLKVTKNFRMSFNPFQQ